jgi:hypothetical protein
MKNIINSYFVILLGLFTASLTYIVYYAIYYWVSGDLLMSIPMFFVLNIILAFIIFIFYILFVTYLFKAKGNFLILWLLIFIITIFYVISFYFTLETKIILIYPFCYPIGILVYGIIFYIKEWKKIL